MNSRIRKLRVALLSGDLIQPEMRGLSRYTLGLATALSRRSDVDLLLCSRFQLHPRYDGLEGERWIFPASREMLWEHIALPAQLRKQKIDILHAPSNRGLPAWAPCPMVLTRHDAIERLFPADFQQTARSRIRMLISDEVSLRRAARVVTVSETSRRDIARLWRLAPEKIVSLGEGIDQDFFTRPSSTEIDVLRSKLGLKSGYIAYLGGFDRRKDLPTLVQAMAMSRDIGKPCAIAGSFRTGIQSLRSCIEANGVSDIVQVFDELSDSNARAFIAGADCFVYPSRYEGFGLQAAESMALGVPLVTSDGGSLPEITGWHSIGFRVGDARELAAALRKLFADPAGTARMVDDARAYAERYRWDAVIDRYVDLYSSLTTGRRAAQ